MNHETNRPDEMNGSKTRSEKYRERHLSRARTRASKYLQQLEELPGAPKELGYFTDVLRRVLIDNEVIRYADDEKFVGTFCQTVSPEIIRAAGARPIRLCSNTFLGSDAGDDRIANYACPLVKSIVRGVAGEMSEVYKTCDLFVVPLTCDCKRSLAAQLAEYRPTLPLYVPMNREDDESMRVYVEELKKVAGKVSEITGIQVTRKSLTEQIKRYSDVQKEIRTFVGIKGGNDIVIRGTHASAVMYAMAYDDIVHWGEHLKKLNAELLERKKNGDYITKRRLPRILLAGSPISIQTTKIPLMIEEQGGIVVADETCTADRCVRDWVSISEDTLDGCYRAIANRTVRPCSCPVFSDDEPKLHRLEKTARETRADGIIYHVLKGCLENDYEFRRIESHFAAKGIPVVRIESDYGDEDVEQLRIRIEAFIEIIKFGSKKKGEATNV